MNLKRTVKGQLLPVRMRPAFRSGKLTPWGGDGLKTLYGKDIPEDPTGESLEVSCIPGLESRDPQGETLPELIRKYGRELAGDYAERPFPLLLKLISARDKLSVQVHPDDDYAGEREHGKLGKTEAWLILDAPENAEIVYGIVPGTGLEALRKACIAGGAVTSLLRRVKVRAGDVIYIPAGCVHAIGAGITLYEIQQSSDLTYRFFDWDRTDANGLRRELHLDKALDVTDLSLELQPRHAGNKPGAERVLDQAYFTLDILRPQDGMDLPGVREFGILTALDEELGLAWDGGSMTLKKGETCFLPHTVPALRLTGKGSAALSMPADGQTK